MTKPVFDLARDTEDCINALAASLDNIPVSMLSDDAVHVLNMTEAHFCETLGEQTYEAEFKKFLFDLWDMQITGEKIDIAYSLLDEDIGKFIALVGARSAEFVGQVNKEIIVTQHLYSFKINFARTGAPAPASPVLEAAIRKEIDDAAQRANDLQVIEEGSEYVHAFFAKALQMMQERKQFLADFRLDTGTGYWAVFKIGLVDIVDKDGKPFTPQSPGAEPTL